MAAAIKPVLRVEVWHGFLLVGLWGLARPLGLLDPLALFLGGLFMGVNFILLGLGVHYVLAPVAERRKVRTGLILLVLKLVLFLGLISVLLTRVPIEPGSFAVGVTCLLVAIVAERGWAHLRRR